MKSSLEEGMVRAATAAELRKRGLRFLPAQVLKRSLRKLTYEIRVEDPLEIVFDLSKRQA